MVVEEAIATKKCGVCGETKPTTEFFRLSQGRPGFRSYCKPCNRIKSKDWEQRNIEHVRAMKAAQMKQWREDHPERWKEISDAAFAKYKKTDAYKQKQARAIERRKRLYPERLAAKQAVKIAVTAGRLVRQPCETCGEPKTHGHHDDYSKPLSVRWLCQKHHVEHHRNQRRGV